MAGDFNGDGKLDLAVADTGSNTVAVLLNNGSGGFFGAVTYSTGGGLPDALAAADFNGDGKLDLAVANADGNSIGILLNNGSGGFSAATTFATGGTADWTQASSPATSTMTARWTWRSRTPATIRWASF